MSAEFKAKHPAWLDFTEGYLNVSEAALKDFHALKREEISKNDDILLAYFTSGTTSHPKLVSHNFL